jgi:hypothetical protein
MLNALLQHDAWNSSFSMINYALVKNFDEGVSSNDGVYCSEHYRVFGISILCITGSTTFQNWTSFYPEVKRVGSM